MRFVQPALAFVLMSTWPAGAPGEVAPAQDKLAYGRSLTLKELLAAHKQWLKTADETLLEGMNKAKEEDIEAWYSRLGSLVGSDWGSDQGRLVLNGANLRSHYLKGENLSYANLKGAKLWDAKLEGAELIGANLQEAELVGPNLQGANLIDAYLQGANLSGANLQGALLLGVDLRGQYLEGADLAEADLGEANLDEAKLGRANLQRVNFQDATLQGARLWQANLESALYEPKPGSVPDVVSLSSARNLDSMRFENSPHGLEDLRREFRKAGYIEQERQITHAIKRSGHENAWRDGEYIGSAFNYVFFYLPVGYGLYPGRALRVLALLIAVFALVYGMAIARPSEKHGIYHLWPKERIETRENGAEVADAVKLEQLPRDWRHALGYAVYFSVLSAFHIGWRELNMGNWISRLQFRTYTLQATGWVRTVSGLQSLISVYLLAMWALTYFGRPFE